MTDLSISDDEFENYINCFKEKNLEKNEELKKLNNSEFEDINISRYEKNNPEINFKYKEENNNINFVNYLLDSLKNKKTIEPNNINEDDFGKKRKLRTKKKEIDLILKNYLNEDRSLWKNDKINKISKETNLLAITIKKWNVRTLKIK